MSAKSILDQTLKKLESNVFATNDESIIGQRKKLIERINQLMESIAVIRKSKSKKIIEENQKDEENPQKILTKH